MTAVSHARDFDRAQAADLARAGDHEAARLILEDLGRDPSTLDLLARVHAQRGDLAAASAAWDEVLAVDPAHASALAGTRLIAAITEGKRRARPVPLAAAGGALAVVTVAVAAVLLSTSAPPTRSPLPPHPDSPATQQATRQAVVTPDPALMASLAGPDVRLEPAGTGVRVVFLHGMFLPDSTSLTAAGRRQLEQWGQLLRGKEVRVTVFGHGVTVPGGPVAGGSATAVARAAAAVEVLATAGEQPATAFVLRSAEQSDAPHADADPGLNRTVTLQVDPR